MTHLWQKKHCMLEHLFHHNLVKHTLNSVIKLPLTLWIYKLRLFEIMRDTFLRCNIVAVGTKQPQFRGQSETGLLFLFYFFTLEGSSVVDIGNACIIAELLKCLVLLCSGRLQLFTKARWRTNTWQEIQVKYCLFYAGLVWQSEWTILVTSLNSQSLKFAHARGASLFLFRTDLENPHVFTS